METNGSALPVSTASTGAASSVAMVATQASPASRRRWATTRLAAQMAAIKSAPAAGPIRPNRTTVSPISG